MVPVKWRLAFTRAIAAVLLMMLTPGINAAAGCTGWTGSAADRMACCQREDAGCAAVSADDCCADNEQRRNAETHTALPTPEDSHFSVAILVALSPLRENPAARNASGERPPTYLLDSVFRI